MTAKYDVIIKNGKIIDGSGNPWFKADIGFDRTAAQLGCEAAGIRGAEKIRS